MAGGTAYAASSTSATSSSASTTIYGCYDSGGNLKVDLPLGSTTCPKGYSALDWNMTGPAGQNGTSVVTSNGAPPAPCTPGDTDIELTAEGQPGNGEVLTCNSSGTAWTDTGVNIQGPAGQTGTNGANGTSIATSVGPPSLPCTSGDTDIELNAGGGQGGVPNGEVLTCNSSGAWNDMGVSIQGPPGQNGSNGTSPTVTPITANPANPNCPNGGAEVTDGNNPPNTAYVCDGTNGTNGTDGKDGTNGTNGANGVSQGVQAVINTQVQLPARSSKPVQVMSTPDVPATGDYYVSASVEVVIQPDDIAFCEIDGTNWTVVSDPGNTSTTVVDNLPLVNELQVTKGDPITVSCYSQNGSTDTIFQDGTINAILIDSSN